MGCISFCVRSFARSTNTDLTGAPVVDYQTHAVVGVIAKRGEDLVIVPYP
jgi:hypothetical protein